MDKEKTTLKILATDMYNNINRITSIDKTFDLNLENHHILAFKCKNRWTS